MLVYKIDKRADTRDYIIIIERRGSGYQKGGAKNIFFIVYIRALI